jgi:hypothetical protein
MIRNEITVIVAPASLMEYAERVILNIFQNILGNIMRENIKNSKVINR